ncbi:hypothetical protein [Mucilaginibacter sp.]
MNSTSLSLWDRFKADSPIIFKVLQLIALLVILAVLTLPIPISTTIKASALSGSFAVVFLCFFVVQDAQTLSSGLTAENLLKLVTDIPSQLAQVKDAIASPSADIATIIQAIQQLTTSTGPVTLVAGALPVNTGAGAIPIAATIAADNVVQMSSQGPAPTATPTPALTPDQIIANAQSQLDNLTPKQ